MYYIPVCRREHYLLRLHAPVALKHDPPADVHLAWEAGGPGDLTEKCAGGRRVGRGEMGAVHRVQELTPYLELRSFGDAKAFNKRYVPAMDAGPAGTTQPRGERAVVARQLGGRVPLEPGRVEPAAEGPLPLRQRDAAQVAAEEDVAKG